MVRDNVRMMLTLFLEGSCSEDPDRETHTSTRGERRLLLLFVFHRQRIVVTHQLELCSVYAAVL
jgi:hypothetical protein